MMDGNKRHMFARLLSGVRDGMPEGARAFGQRFIQQYQSPPGQMRAEFQEFRDARPMRRNMPNFGSFRDARAYARQNRPDIEAFRQRIADWRANRPADMTGEPRREAMSMWRQQHPMYGGLRRGGWNR